MRNRANPPPETSPRPGPDFRGLRIYHSHLNHRSLYGADFRAGTLIGVDFRGADLRQARFTGADVQADFRRASLRGAQLDADELLGSDLRGADCRECEFGGADLTLVKLKDCDLRGANLSRAGGVTRREFARAVTDARTRSPTRWLDDREPDPADAWFAEFTTRLDRS